MAKIYVASSSGLVFLVKNDLQEGFLASLNTLTRC